MPDPTTDNTSIELPESNYGPEVRALEAILKQMRTLTTHVEGILFSLQVHSHRMPSDKYTHQGVTMEEGDVVPATRPRATIRGLRGVISQEPVITDPVLPHPEGLAVQ